MNDIFNGLRSMLAQNGPRILMWLGIGGMAAGTGLAVYETTKLPEKIKQHNEEVKKVKEETVEDAKTTRELAKVYLRTGLRVAALYTPAIVASGLGAVSIVKSNDILAARNESLAAACAAVIGSFATYRGRVKDRFGQEVDQELQFGIETKTVTEEEVDKNGKKHKVKRTRRVINTSDGKIPTSDYARFFDVGNPFYSDIQSENKFFLNGRQHLAQQLLTSRGYLFLNEVYDMLGFPQTIEGQSLGWVYTKNPEEQVGDPYVDFRLVGVDYLGCEGLHDYYESAYLLDFNCCDIMNGYFKTKLNGNRGILDSALLRLPANRRKCGVV